MTAIMDNGAATDWLGVARDLGAGFAARAAEHDAAGTFVADNYVELKQQRVFSALVPTELGGGGASPAQVCALLGEIARQCGSTALALSMHMHLVAAAVWRYRQGLPTDALLRRIAEEELVLVSTGASDWLESSGTANRVDGGYSVTARKVFGSGSPAGDLLVTSAPFNDPTDGPTVLHFPIPMTAAGLTVLDNWRAMGMRGTGSNDILLDNVFVPEHDITLRRPHGQWHPFFNLNVIVAMPLVMSVYLGIATAARDIAIQHARKRSAANPETWYLLGEMENAFTTAQLAVHEMVETSADYSFAADNATANRVLVRKTIAAQAMLESVEKSLRTVGGSGIFTSVGLERLLRDIHGAEFHPLQEKRQQRLTGRVLLGLDPA